MDDDYSDGQIDEDQDMDRMPLSSCGDGLHTTALNESIEKHDDDDSQNMCSQPPEDSGSGGCVASLKYRTGLNEKIKPADHENKQYSPPYKSMGDDEASAHGGTSQQSNEMYSEESPIVEKGVKQPFTFDPKSEDYKQTLMLPSSSRSQKATVTCHDGEASTSDHVSFDVKHNSSDEVSRSNGLQTTYPPASQVGDLQNHNRKVSLALLLVCTFNLIFVYALKLINPMHAH